MVHIEVVMATAVQVLYVLIGENVEVLFLDRKMLLLFTNLITVLQYLFCAFFMQTCCSCSCKEWCDG